MKKSKEKFKGSSDRKRKLEDDSKQREGDPPSDFDGYAMRGVILEKWGRCYDVDFNRVDSFGFKSLYLNILPFQLGGRRFRHATELDYLCHLQAVVEILVKYKQVSDAPEGGWLCRVVAPYSCFLFSWTMS